MNTLSLRYFGAAFFAAGALSGLPAHAALTFADVACDGHGTGMTSQPGYISCAGAFKGNTLNQQADVASQIYSVWALSDLTVHDITGRNSGKSGTLSFANQSGLFVISLKAGNAFSLYEFDGAVVSGGISSISFDTLGVGSLSDAGKRKERFGEDLGHAELYSILPAVPEPETYALMLAGFGLVGVVARRRKVR